jgi:hypothetical protein
MITLGPSLMGLRGTQVTSSIIHTLVSVRDLEDQLASLESHVSELEDETTELCKENEAVLGRDDDH